ncbi:MAG TPA: TRAP transporter small permease [Candidatus Aquicultoraceae bacterium]|nr:TRAP transporter small permease [Candidatus Aquicultoraceae bacterium]
MRSGWNAFRRAVGWCNFLTGYLSGLLIVVSTVAITFEVVARYFFRAPHDWSLELNIFLLIASTFLAAAFTQEARAHVGIEVLENLLSPRWNRWRHLTGDVLSAAFCAFVAYYAWRYFGEAWEKGWVTDSTWAPKLWIPYFFMSLGMSTLALQFVVQIVDDLFPPAGRKE